jgi:hypothetical protein
MEEEGTAFSSSPLLYKEELMVVVLFVVVDPGVLFHKISAESLEGIEW